MELGHNVGPMNWVKTNEFGPKFLCSKNLKFCDVMKNNLTLNHNYRGLLLIHIKFIQSTKLELTINET